MRRHMPLIAFECGSPGDANKTQAAEMIATVLKEEIEKARVRIANKQARLLAQMKS